MTFTTADLSDEHPDAAVASPALLDFGGRPRFAGPIRTVRCLDDNSLVRATLEETGEDAVLIVDGGGSLRCALLGGNLGALAISNGWAGVIVNGCVRDSSELSTMDLGVMALATHPRKSIKRGAGSRDVPVSFSGIDFTPGAWVYADGDGVLVSPTAIHG
jgi:regulator of ribonuclease activity A